MVRWLIVLAAIAVYGVALSCVMWPTSTPAHGQQTGEPDGSAAASATTLEAPPPPAPLSQSRQGLPYCGVGMQIQRTDWIDKYKQCIDEIAALGADAVRFDIDTRQENIHSTHIFMDVRMTPNPDQLGDLIRYAKGKKLRVILMPIVLLDNPVNNDWRGVIDPDTRYGGWTEWFESYRKMLYQFSWIAEANGVDVFVIGTEYISAEPHVAEWGKTINEVRKVFHGRLTYSSNWDHYKSVKFWNYLDLIGMNSYWTFGEKGTNESPSVEHIMDRWKDIQSDLIPFVQQQKKPLLFLEIGWFSQKNVAYEPWDYTQDLALDLEIQRKLYDGFFKSWWGNPNLGGFFVWNWPPGEGGPEDKGYTPKGKPAEKVLREWLGKPRWDVK